MSSEPVVPIRNTKDINDTNVVSPSVAIAGELPIASDVTAPSSEPAPRLRDTAETVGTAMGKAVNRARELPRRLAEMKQRFTVIRGRATEDAASTAQEVRQNARQKVSEARTRAEQLANDYPVEFILGVGASAFVLGFALRIWRSSRRG